MCARELCQRQKIRRPLSLSCSVGIHDCEGNVFEEGEQAGEPFPESSMEVEKSRTSSTEEASSSSESTVVEALPQGKQSRDERREPFSQSIMWPGGGEEEAENLQHRGNIQLLGSDPEEAEDSRDAYIPTLEKIETPSVEETSMRQDSTEGPELQEEARQMWEQKHVPSPHLRSSLEPQKNSTQDTEVSSSAWDFPEESDTLDDVSSTEDEEWIPSKIPDGETEPVEIRDVVKEYISPRESSEEEVGSLEKEEREILPDPSSPWTSAWQPGP